MLGALADGCTRVKGLPNGADVASTRRCLEALGTTIRDVGGDIAIYGRGGDFDAPRGVLDCGNSGTTMRLLTAILAAREIDATLDGDASLRARPMLRIAEPLRAMGAQVELRDDLRAPIRVRGSSQLHAIDYELPVASAQLKSALVLAALGARGTTKLGGLVRSRDHTERMLPMFGGHIVAEGGTIAIDGPQKLRAPQEVVIVPGDVSSAAFWIAAATIVPNSRIELQDVGLNPTRLGFIDVLSRMGASVEVHPRQSDFEPFGTIIARSATLRATTVAGDEVPALIDELPLLAVVAAFAEGTTRVCGAEELRHKESDRIAAVVVGARAMGIQIEELEDGFSVTGPASLRGCEIDAMGDHRIAMAFAIASLGSSAPTTIFGAESVAISYPDFFSTLEGLRG
jgi:3-phosphoshikimate 1-carboxyvinyltransferase